MSDKPELIRGLVTMTVEDRDAMTRERDELRAENERLTHLHNLDHSLADQRGAEVERLRAGLKRAADAPCSHCAATWLHGEQSTAHHWADQALGHHKE